MKRTAMPRVASLIALLAIVPSCVSDACDAVPPQPAFRRPNIVFILADDHAAPALSCYGGTRNSTPSPDRLAREGMRFDRAVVVNSICTPSRATLLTGK